MPGLPGAPPPLSGRASQHAWQSLLAQQQAASLQAPTAAAAVLLGTRQVAGAHTPQSPELLPLSPRCMLYVCVFSFVRLPALCPCCFPRPAFSCHSAQLCTTRSLFLPEGVCRQTPSCPHNIVMVWSWVLLELGMRCHIWRCCAALGGPRVQPVALLSRQPAVASEHLTYSPTFDGLLGAHLLTVSGL